ncbi:polysaccharide deacetylase family protein [Clostridium sp. D2Q-11]|uniref:Polysaccharide deacetylase family protein n=1 Tax=Anaeromonas frigoriresistens TaxID=2683708 RepID=A0A942Z9E2_9FIRM|nr:polysaccharide deacetylase family protein [Anaeromonas frigoriresistens]MBS4539228.1 polysaccharide deacetylase family protein [Anaeromonas frigoriresistens]
MKNYLFKKNKNNLIKITLVLFLLSISALWVKSENTNIYQVLSPNKELPIYSVDRQDKKVSISFDAAWGDKFTREILDILDEHNVKTTFFLVEFWVEKYPDLVKEIDARGHEIGNHSSNHPYMSKLNDIQIIDELERTEDKVYELIGKRTTLFRPPFGDYNDRLINVCKENGYHVIQWNIDSLDWKERGVQPVVDRVIKNVDDGSIILFHNNAKYVTEYLPIVLKELKNKGYEVTPISKLIYKDDYYIDHEGRQFKK